MTGSPTIHAFRWRDLALLALVCAVSFWWSLGKLGLTDPDEPFYAETAREMLQQHDWITPRIFGAPQFEKPILFYWLSMVSFKMCGVNEFGARLPSALAGTVLVLLTYVFGARWFGRRAGLFGALVLATAVLVVLMGRLMLTDMVFALLVSGSLFSLWHAIADERRRPAWLVCHFVCTGLAVMTKGPLGSVIPALAAVTWRWPGRGAWPFRGAGLWWGLAAYGVIVVPWFAVMFGKFGWEYFKAFVVHENLMRLIVAEHPKLNHIWFYPGMILLGSIPWLPVVAAMIGRAWRQVRGHRAGLFVLGWTASSLVFLTLAQSKLHSYILFLFVPVALLTGQTLDALVTSGCQSKTEAWLVRGLGLAQVVGIAVALLKRGVAVPVALVAGAVLAVLLLLQWRGWWAVWSWGNAVVVMATVVAALHWGGAQIEAITSVKSLAGQVLREQLQREPIVCGRSLARGMFFYAQRPVWVVANKPQPFYSPHALPVILGKQGLGEFLQTHDPSFGVFTSAEWDRLHRSAGTPSTEDLHLYGHKVLVRLHARGDEEL